MERVILKYEPGALFVRQALFDQGKIQIRVAAINLIADNGMAEMRQMDADLMLAAGARLDTKQGKS